jgi:hypothetical protein
VNESPTSNDERPQNSKDPDFLTTPSFLTTSKFLTNLLVCLAPSPLTKIQDVSGIGKEQHQPRAIEATHHNQPRAAVSIWREHAAGVPRAGRRLLNTLLFVFWALEQCQLDLPRSLRVVAFSKRGGAVFSLGCSRRNALGMRGSEEAASMIMT